LFTERKKGTFRGKDIVTIIFDIHFRTVYSAFSRHPTLSVRYETNQFAHPFYQYVCVPVSGDGEQTLADARTTRTAALLLKISEAFLK